MSKWDVDDWVFFMMTGGLFFIVPVIAVVCFAIYKIAELFA